MIDNTGVFILLISFLNLVTSFPPELGDSFKCGSRNGKFPKPGSFCRSYYLCSNWSPKEKVCPQDQHFFPSKGYCVWADDFPCLEKPKSKECPLPDGKFLKPRTDCKVYYDCCKGKPTEKKCAKGTLFDHKRGKCDWPEYVKCPDDVSTSKSSSQSTSTLSISSTSVSKSTTEVITPPISPKIPTTDSDEDSSSAESSSSEEGNSSEENRQSSTKSEFMSTSIISSTTNDEYTGSTEGDVTKSSTESSSTVENSSRSVSSSTAPEDSSTYPEIKFTASVTEEFTTTTSTYPEVVTEETHTESVTKETHPEVVIEITQPKIVTTEETHTESVTKETRPEIVTGETRTEVVTKETHPEATYTVENKDDYSTITPGLTDPVTTHIFCPKPNGHFPHPYDKHKFIACVGGNPTVMNCPEDLIYDHKKRSCEYNYKKRKINKMAKYL